MKLTEDMGEELMSTSMANCDNISEEISLKSGKVSTNNALDENLSHAIPNCENGIDNSTLSLTNGNASPDHPKNQNLDQDLIGFEVESYNANDSPFPPETHSEIDLDQEGSSSQIKISKCVSEDHNSSHASDEFNLRLSDDEDGNESAIPRGRLGENESVTSTTDDSCDLITHEDSSKGSSGSETVKKNDLLTSESLGSNTSPVKKPVIGGDNSLPELTSNRQSSVTEKEMSANSPIKESETHFDIAISSIETIDQENLPNTSSSPTVQTPTDPSEDKADCKLKDTDTSKETLEQEAISTDVPTNNPELSLEDKIEAELEAELQAEIDAQIETDKTLSHHLNQSNVAELADPSNGNSVKPIICEEGPVSEEGSSKAASNNDECVEGKQNICDRNPKENQEDSIENVPLKIKVEKNSDEGEPDKKENLEIKVKADLEVKSESDSNAHVKTETNLKSEIKIKTEPGLKEEEDAVKQEVELKSVVDIESSIKSEPNIKIESSSLDVEDHCNDSSNLTETCEVQDTQDEECVIEAKSASESNLIAESLTTPDEEQCQKTSDIIVGTSISSVSEDIQMDPDTLCDESTESRKDEQSLSLHTDENVSQKQNSEKDSVTNENTSPSKDQSEILDLRDSESRLLSPVTEVAQLQENIHSDEACDMEDILRSGSNESNSVDDGELEQTSKSATDQELFSPNTNLDDEETEDMTSIPNEPSETNSLLSDNEFECQDTELPGDSDNSTSGDNSDNCAANENEDFDAICEKETNRAFKEVANQGVETVGTEFNTNSTKAHSYCESSALDASSTDDMDSVDCSSNISESNHFRGYNTDISSKPRKRTLSEDDSCDSFKSKKPNGFPEIRRDSDSLDTRNQTQSDSSHKRPAERIEDLERKKFRVCEESRSEESVEVDQDEERLLKSPKASCPQGASVSETPKTPDSFSDFIIENPKELQPFQTVSTDLPFLRKLYKRELTKMSRSDLEELVVQKICEAITERSVVGDLRLRCQELEKRQEKENERFNKLRKQMTELSLVVKKYMEQHSKNPNAKIIKITRSVGLQVSQTIKHVQPCPAAVRTRLPVSPNAKQLLPLNKPAPANPLRPDMSIPEISCQVRTPVKSYRNNSSSPRSSIVSSTEPPALAPTQRGEKVVSSIPNKPPLTTSPRLQQIPPLQQISGARPRLNIPVSASSTLSSSPPALAHKLSSAPVPILPKPQPSPVRQSLPQNTNRPPIATNRSDVEVIDIIDKDEKNTNKKTAAVHISPQQQAHQAKQAANAAAQNLATNSGMTVRLISPTQVSQSGVLSSGFPQLIVSNPSSGVPQKMILASQGSPIRGNLKLVVQGKPGNVLIPFSSSSGTTPSNTVVQQVQQIFSNSSISNKTNTVATGPQQRQLQSMHPAPLPTGPMIQPSNPLWRQIPPKPNLKIQHQNNGIVLSWNMALGPIYADIDSYQLYAYQEGSAPPSAGLWKKVGDVKALPLPMACTLTQFVEGHRYHFTVRAVDKHGRVGPFSQQGSIRLGN